MSKIGGLLFLLPFVTPSWAKNSPRTSEEDFTLIRLRMMRYKAVGKKASTTCIPWVPLKSGGPVGSPYGSPLKRGIPTIFN